MTLLRLSAFLLAMVAGMARALAAGPVLYLDDPELMAALEGRGYSFAGIFATGGKDDLATLHGDQPAYRTIVKTIGADVAELQIEIEAGGREVHEATNREVGRIIDMRWLSSEAARFRLIAVVNRLDRRDFAHPDAAAGCGEVRFVYRLAYRFEREGRVLSSRLPFNFNAVHTVLPDADGGCTGVARRWTPAIDDTVDAGWLAGGVLDPSELVFKQLELNAQVVRFPSGQEPEFGGQAVYLMRIFGIDGDTIEEKTLENTPDTSTLKEDDAALARLADYVRTNAHAIDLGVYRMPEEFLARKVVSWSTFGGARRINRPFGELFDAGDFSAVDFSRLRLVKSPEALIARLDNGACQGCHQAASTAGFHVIGQDNDDTSPLNRVAVGISPHLDAELARRTAYVSAVGEDRSPNRFRPLSFAPPADWGEDGAMAYRPAEATMGCIAPEDAALFGQIWPCGAGTTCTPLAAPDDGGPALAQCLVTEEKDMFSGHPCLAGDMSAGTEVPFADDYRVKQFAAFAKKASARDYTCRPPKIGVPGGMAYRQCDEKDRAFSRFRDGAPMPREICGLTGGKKFDLCVATGDFSQCLSGAVQRGNRAACSAGNFCRDDYICQAFPDDTPNAKKVAAQGIGFCSPTYFLFQMRIDNHATPWPRELDRELGEEPAYRSVEVEGDPDDLW